MKPEVIIPALIGFIFIFSGIFAAIAYHFGKNNLNQNQTSVEVENATMIKAGDEIFIGNKKVIVLSRKGNILTVARIED